MNPLVWRTIEAATVANSQYVSAARSARQMIQTSTAPTSGALTSSFFSFFSKVCSQVIDLSLEINAASAEELTTHLDAIFQVRSLQRCRCVVTSLNDATAFLTYQTDRVPACRDLKLLNLHCISIDESSQETILSVSFLLHF